jgi:regulator of cell morphogenesis and NO signaling
MTVTSASRVGEIATHHPLATRVFARHGIDFCCGGGVALADACAKRGLDADTIVDEITRTVAAPGNDDPQRWDRAPLPALVRHIVEHYHAALREELPRLEAMARKVHRVHGDRDPERLGALLDTYLGLVEEVQEHLRDEEERLFPAILSRDPNAAGSIGELVDDHSRVGQELARIRELTDDFQVPADACNTWNALWHGLAALERDLHQHIHLENNVLFPRVAA